MNARYAAQIRAGITLAQQHVRQGIEWRKSGDLALWIATVRQRIDDRKALSKLAHRAYLHTIAPKDHR